MSAAFPYIVETLIVILYVAAGLLVWHGHLQNLREHHLAARCEHYGQPMPGALRAMCVLFAVTMLLWPLDIVKELVLGASALMRSKQAV